MTRPATGQVAVVTGANRGIGLELVHQLVTAGYVTVLTARTRAKAEAAAGSFDDPSGVLAAELDVASDRSVAAFGDWLADNVARVDVLVNNAGIGYDTWAHATTVSIPWVHEVLETNLFGAWRVTQRLLPLLRTSERARVVNVSSEGGSLSGMGGGTPAYSVSKAALNALTRLMSAELARDGILVNAVCPGWTDTDMGQGGRPVTAGAASVMWAVELPSGGPTGTFTRDGRELPW